MAKCDWTISDLRYFNVLRAYTREEEEDMMQRYGAGESWWSYDEGENAHQKDICGRNGTEVYRDIRSRWKNELKMSKSEIF